MLKRKRRSKYSKCEEQKGEWIIPDTNETPIRNNITLI